MRTLSLLLARGVLAALFFVSGMTKLNDPLGFSYKIEEYFSPQVLNLPFLSVLSLPLAIFISALEVFLSYVLVFRDFLWRMRWVVFALLAFFTLLTFYTAYTGSVKECGCFGDALVLSPWTTFWKDVVFLIISLPLVVVPFHVMAGPIAFVPEVWLLSLILVILSVIFLLDGFWFLVLYWVISFIVIGGVKYFLPLKKISLLVAMVVLSVFPGLYVYYYNLPFKDYLPYKVGNNIKKLMEVPPDAPQPKYEITLYYKNKKTGEIKGFSTSDAPWRDTATWEYHDTETKLIEEGYRPPITDFLITDINGNDITEQVLSDAKGLWIIARSLGDVPQSAINKIKNVVEEASKRGVPTYLMSSNSSSEVKEFMDRHGIRGTGCVVDEVTLKSMVRANPGIMAVKTGIIVGKWHWRSLPSPDKILKILEEIGGEGKG